MTPIC